MKYLLLALLTGCASLSMTEQAARSGYTWAAMCIGYATIPYEDVKRQIMDGEHFAIKATTDAGRDTIYVGLIGYADFEGKRILIAKSYRSNAKLWAHEYVHYLPKVKEHPDSLFIRCNLR